MYDLFTEQQIGVDMQDIEPWEERLSVVCYRAGIALIVIAYAGIAGLVINATW